VPLVDRSGVNARWCDVMFPGTGKRLGSGLGDYELLALECWRHSLVLRRSSSSSREEQSFVVRPKSLSLTAQGCMPCMVTRRQKQACPGMEQMQHARKWGETRSKSTPPSGGKIARAGCRHPSGSGDAAAEEGKLGGSTPPDGSDVPASTVNSLPPRSYQPEPYV
jgi:hypothetical protein